MLTSFNLTENRVLKYKILLIFILLIGFFIIASHIKNNSILVIDESIRYFMYSIRSDNLTVFFKFITNFADYKTIVILSILILSITKINSKFGIPCALAIIISTITNHLVKDFFKRTRPDSDFHLIIQGGYSFPSGHAMASLVFYGMISYILFAYAKNIKSSYKKSIILKVMGLFLIVLIILISFSRLYLGVHYFTDVIGGWCLGGIIIILASIGWDYFFITRHNKFK